MTSFLAAQAAAPHDPAPMLIHADWLEEHGDLAGAAALRGLAAAGYQSLVGLALGAGSWGSVTYQPDGVHGAGAICDDRDGSGNGDCFGGNHEGEGDGSAELFRLGRDAEGGGGIDGWSPWYGAGDGGGYDKDTCA